MKNYKILENRPELTNEQVVNGMDFNKIKNNVAIAKSSILKSLAIKGFFGTIIIATSVLVYKNIKHNEEQKTEVIFTDTTDIISANKVDSSTIVTESTITDKTSVVDRKSSIKNSLANSSSTNDTVTINKTSSFNPEPKKSSYVVKTDFYTDEEESNSKKVNGFTKAFGPNDIKEITKSFAKINETLYASKYEVSNKLYMAFINSLVVSNNTNLLAIAQIDTSRWISKLSYNEPYMHYYHKHPAYNNYPVVNISYEGAKLFCEWLTVQYNADPKRKFKKVFFRLPTENEWIMAAQAGNAAAIYPWEGTTLHNKKGQMMANFIRNTDDTLGREVNKFTGADVTAPVDSYWKNNFGIFNMSGNVAEMISEKGITKGGGWRNDEQYLKIDAKYKYDGTAHEFVGFRYFIEIIEK